MNLSDYLEKWGRTIFEAPLAAPPRAGEPPELAEIRLAILDEVRGKTYRAGGRKVFPFDLVRVFARGVEESRAAVFAGSFFRRYLEQELRAALRDADCRHPAGLRVEVATTAELPKPGEQWLTIESVAAKPHRAARVGRARLVVLEGAATASEVPLEKGRVNIGRTVDVYRSEGLFRRNDLAFAEDNEINRTVSREHAHITFDRASGEYRLHNDRWYALGRTGPADCATWIVRDGMSVPVHRNARGTRLEPGDEIHFGRAVVLFRMD